MKAAIVVMSDPASGSEEALGRLFNGLAAASDFAAAGDEVTVLFQGAGTRWAELVEDAGHPAHALYEAVRDRVAGVSAACADVFGASAGAARVGLARRGENPVPGTAGLPSLRQLQRDGYSVLIF